MNEHNGTLSGDKHAGTLLFPEAKGGVTKTGFLSCHASSVLPLDGGVVLAAYFAGDREGADNVGIWLSRKERDTWEPPVLLAKTQSCAHWNPVLFNTKDGVRVVFKVGQRIHSWESYTALSKDCGKTWTTPAPYGGDNAAGGPVRSKPIRLSNGALLAPNSDETATSWTARVDISYDEGKSFSKFADIPLNTCDDSKADFISGKGAIQPTLWESCDGSVHALLRTTCGFIFRSDSRDGGRTWCTAYNTGMPNNNSGIDIERTRSGLYLCMNPVGGNWAARTPLVIMKSSDNGLSFSRFATLADIEYDETAEKPAEFSYPAIVCKDDRLYVTYTYMRRSVAFHEIPLD